MTNTLHTTWTQVAKRCHILHIKALQDPSTYNKQVLGLAIEKADNARKAYLKSQKDNVRLAA